MAAYGEQYLTDPLHAIERKLSYGVKDIQARAKHGLDEPREVIYPTAAENVLYFNDELIKALASGDIDKEDCDVLITQYLAIEQVPWA